MGVLYKSENIALLKRSVESMLAQSIKEIEFLICYKELSKAAQKYLLEISKQDQRVILIDGHRCNHLGGQLNLCISKAKGEFIARMDDDDFSYPDRLKKQLEFLKKRHEIQFVGCNVKLVCEGKEIGARELPAYPGVKDFLFTQPYVHPTMMFRKTVLEKVGGYSDNKNQEGCEDYDLFLRLYEQGLYGANLGEMLLDYTIPLNEKNKRTMRWRLNEVKTRFARFKALGLLPRAVFYVVKPVAVGLVFLSARGALNQYACKKRGELNAEQQFRDT